MSNIIKTTLSSLSFTSVRVLFLIAFLIIFQSCRDSSTDPVDPYNYYPLAVGQYQTYQVKEEVYSSGQTAPTIRTWQEKDQVTSVTSISSGISKYIISRSTRASSSDYWSKVKEYSIEQYPDKLLFNIDNLITVPLVFPINSTITWNGNMYNTLDKENYRFEEVNSPYKISDQSFSKTLTLVERRDTTSVINYALGIKRYALGVGLVYDEQTAYEFCQATPDCIGKGIIDSGSKKTRTIIEYSSLKE